MAKKSLNFATKSLLATAIIAAIVFAIPTTVNAVSKTDQSQHSSQASTIDSLSAILITAIFSAAGLGFGIATKSRRNY